MKMTKKLMILVLLSFVCVTSLFINSGCSGCRNKMKHLKSSAVGLNRKEVVVGLL